MKNILHDKPTTELSGFQLDNIRCMDRNDIFDKEILDIGCGFGWFEMYAVRDGAERICGIEPSEAGLMTAKNNVDSNDGVVSFHVASAVDLPFSNDSFDTVTAWEVLEHIPKGSEARMFKEVHRVLRDGGVFYLSTPQTSFLGNILDPAWWFGHRHYSPEDLKSYARKIDFAVNYIRSRGRYWELINIMNLYIAKWVFRRRPFFERFMNIMTAKELQRDDAFVDVFVKYTKECDRSIKAL